MGWYLRHLPLTSGVRFRMSELSIYGILLNFDLVQIGIEIHKYRSIGPLFMEKMGRVYIYSC